MATLQSGTMLTGDITLTKKSGTILTLWTDETYCDKDVQFSLGVQEGQSSANTASADASVVSDETSRNISGVIGTKSDTAPSSGYYLRVNASGSGSSKVTTAGWIDKGNLPTASTSATKYFPVTSATVTQNAPTINASTGLVTATTSTTEGYAPTSATASSNTLQLTTKGATTYNTKATDQTIASGTYLTGTQTIRAVSTSNIDASNIKSGVNVKVGDSASTGRIKDVTGTFTSASTVSEGQTAATASQIANGYSAWVNGVEVQGEMPTKTSSDLIVNGKTVIVPAGLYADDASASVANGAITNNTTLPSGKTSSGTINRGSYIKVGEGYHTEKYYLAQANSGTKTISSAGTTSVDGYVNASVAEGSTTQNAPTVNSSGLVTATSTVTAGYQSADTKSNTLQLSTQAGKTVAPTESEQTAVASGKYTTGAVKVGAISSTYVGSGIERKSSTDLTANGATVTASAGYYASDATKTISSTSVTEGVTTVSGSTATRGTWSQTAGYTSARTIGASTFANEATSGKTYVDISNTTSAPVLVSEDYLYINKGYTDDLKISLAKLVPDGSDVKGHGDYLLSGHSAYDNDGTLVAGTIPTIASTDLQVSGKTVTVPVGKYTGASGATAVSASVADGTVSTTFTDDGMSTYFNSGTSSDKNVTITPKYTNTAGYVNAHSTATNNGGTAYYKIKTASPTFSGGTVTGTATANSSTGASLSTTTNNSGVTVVASGSATRGQINYNSAVEGWVSKSANAKAYDAGSATALTNTTYYLNGVTLTAPSSGTRTFAVTLPNGGSDTITLTFTVDSSGNWSIE